LCAALPPGEAEAKQKLVPAQAALAAAALPVATGPAQLEALLAETAAYRAYFRQAGKDTLLLAI
jgi:hypothetical protein